MALIQIPVAGLPIALVLQSDGAIGFVRQGGKWTVIDDGAIFDQNSFSIEGINFEYNQFYAYKTIEPMLNWITKQNLQQPD